tara:strand:+ start:18 stop:458 length:441 start_codon:yes stop_codon:yes gene_type:complete
MSALTEYLENKLINHVFRNVAYTTPGTSIYVGLIGYYESGGSNGLEQGLKPYNAANKELSGGSYARVQHTDWRSPYTIGTSGVIDNNTAVTFPTATGNWGMVSGVIIADASTEGNVLMHGALTTPRDVKSGDVFKFNANDLDITFS